MLGGLFVKDLVNPSLTQHRRDELDQSFSQLMGDAASRQVSELERLWLSAQADRTKVIADFCPWQPVDSAESRNIAGESGTS